MESRFANGDCDAAPLPIFGGPTFSFRHRAKRAVWQLCWSALARWTPPGWMPLRRMVLEAFGARVHRTAMVRSDVRIWWPGYLEMGPHASIGPGAICYNVAPVTLGARATVSQRAHLCAAGHDIDRPDFPLRPEPIRIEEDAWVAAEAFVGPGVVVGRGAVLGARGVAARSLDPWTVYAGNPATVIRTRREVRSDEISPKR